MAGGVLIGSAAAGPPALRAGCLSKMAELDAHLRRLSEEQYVQSYYKVRPAVGRGGAQGASRI